MTPKMCSFKCAYLLIFLGLFVGSTSEKEDLDRLVNLPSRIIPKIDGAWAKVKDPNWVSTGTVGGIDNKLVKLFRPITEEFEGLDGELPAALKDSSLELAQLDKELKSLNGFFDRFKKFQERNDVAVWQKDWPNFSAAVLQTTPPSVRVSVQRVYEIVTQKPEESFYRKLIKDGDAVSCSLNQSLQQLIFNLYSYMRLVQLKGYVMIQFSWMLLRLNGNGNFTVEAEREQYKFNKQFSEQMHLARQVLETTSNEMQRCDPRKNIENSTYVQITRLLQGYIQNEVDMNEDESCSETCDYYSHTEQHGCFKNKFCAKQSCAGKIHSCQYIGADMGVCMSETGSTRRYNWIQYENGRVLGQRGTCSRDYAVVESWWRWLVLHCSYCFCLCDDERNSDRFFSLRPSVSNTTANKVVTGIRFAKWNRMIHLQVQEGELRPYGGIDQESVAWRPVPDFQTNDTDVKEGVDYHRLSWASRALDLDDIKCETQKSNCLLTGVRLRKIGSHLNLEAECSPFNVTSGKLIKPDVSKIWIGNDNTDGSIVSPRKKLELKNPDIPTRAFSGCPSLQSTSNMYVEFTHSDINADAAQTTVPFIDIQSVAPSPATPLVGVGIYHRGCENYGGYVAPKVMTYDASQNLIDPVSTDIEA